MRRLGGFVLAVFVLAAGLSVPASAAQERTGSTRPGPGPGHARYDIDITGDGFVWHGRQSVRFTNTTGSTLDTVWFRLWGNGVDGCAAPAVRVSALTGGRPGPLAVDCTALPVAVRLPPGATTTVGFDLDITVPDRDTRFGRHAGAAYVTFAFPVLAVHDHDGWHLEPYTDRGEANYALTADWRVRIDHPSALAVPASGVTATRPGRTGRTVTVAHAPRVRDFAFAAGTFTRHTARTRDGVVVRVWQGTDVTEAEVADTLAVATRAMRTFADWYGRYPYPEVDVVTGQFPYGSMEYPTLVAAVPAASAVAHELAHQWWYGLVGNNQYTDPWLDETFTHYSTLRFTGETGADCADPPWLHPDNRISNGHDYWDAGAPGYVATVYLVGACMLNDLEQTLGSDRMLRMLRDYAADNRYGTTTPAEFGTAAQSATTTDLTAFWKSWRVDLR
jgi:aminopeptidase N